MERFRIMDRRNEVPDGDFGKRELQGVEKLYEGKYDQALVLFHQNEIEQPGRYSTAANLGTAYELQGDLDAALKWISEGVVRNPKSHEGTEWLHVAILKTRIKLRQDPNYLINNHILDIPDQLSRSSVLELDGKPFRVDEILTALQYQLEERMVFVKPTDPVVADLLFSYGQLEAQIHIVEAGLGLLNLAKDYGFQNTSLIATKIDQYQSSIHLREKRENRQIWSNVLIAIGGLFLLLLLILAYRKHRA